MMRAFDPRLTPARADIAAKELEGKVDSGALCRGPRFRGDRPASAAARRARARRAAVDRSAQGRARYHLRHECRRLGRGQLAADGYVGWLPANALAPAGAPPTHKVAALRTFAFPGPSIKLPPLEALPLGARLGIVRVADRLAVTRSGGYVPSAHLAPLDVDEPDFVAVAERFLGGPICGAARPRSASIARDSCRSRSRPAGLSCPRDSDMQEQALGAPTGMAADLPMLQRGDLIFWKGHVAIVRDRRDPYSRQRFPYGGRDRADRRRHRPHPRRRKRHYQRAARGAGGCVDHTMTAPPATSKMSPATHDASSEARYRRPARRRLAYQGAGWDAGRAAPPAAPLGYVLCCVR